MSNYNAINDAVCYWLGYQLKIGRDSLIHEASLRYPIADTLTSKDILITQVKLEDTYSCFKTTKYADLTIYSAKESDKILERYEFKIANIKTRNEPQRILDDILRLAYSSLVEKVNSYFLICGTREGFNAYFLGQGNKKPENKQFQAVEKVNPAVGEVNLNDKWNPEKSSYKDYFEFADVGQEDKSKSYTFKKGDDLFENFKKKYVPIDRLPPLGDEFSIKTTCVALTAFGSTQTHACGIWKIEAG